MNENGTHCRVVIENGDERMRCGAVADRERAIIA